MTCKTTIIDHITAISLQLWLNDNVGVPGTPMMLNFGQVVGVSRIWFHVEPSFARKEITVVRTAGVGNGDFTPYITGATLIPDANHTKPIVGFSTIGGVETWSYVMEGEHEYLAFDADAATTLQCYCTLIDV